MPTARCRSIVLAVIGLGLLVAASYSAVLEHDFVNFDDPDYVAANPHVLEGLRPGGVLWAFQPNSIVSGNWHPVTVVSHMVDVQLYGLDAGGHLLGNVLLHGINAALIFTFLFAATGAWWRSVLVAAFFAVHPVQVESVAWISERKNVLSTTFWLLTMLAYLRYVRRPGLGRYTVVVVAFLSGLLAKPMLVTLPFALLLLDLWPLRRNQERGWAALSREKVPLLLLSLVFVAITLRTQSIAGSVSAFVGDEPMSLRLANAAISHVTYLRQLAWPVDLTTFYPYPTSFPGVAAWAGAAVLLVAVSVAAVLAVRHFPWTFVGWFWYLGVMVPVIGLIQVGAQAHADRYLYVPAIGIFVVVAWGVGALVEHRGRVPRIAALAVSVAAVLALLPVTRAQVDTWSDSETLFRHALKVTEPGCNYLAHNNLAEALVGRGAQREARLHFEQAVRCQPLYAIAQMNLGTVLLQEGRAAEAEGHLREATRLSPGFAEAYANLGATLMKLRRFDEAIVHLRRALELKPALQVARNNLERAIGYRDRGS